MVDQLIFGFSLRFCDTCTLESFQLWVCVPVSVQRLDYLFQGES